MYPTKETVEELKKVGLKTLNTSSFIGELHENNFWEMFEGFREHKMNLWMGQVERYMIGFARGGDIPFRPKEDYVAVMFEKDGKKFWFHVSCTVFTPYFLDKEFWNEVYKNR